MYKALLVTLKKLNKDLGWKEFLPTALMAKSDRCTPIDL